MKNSGCLIGTFKLSSVYRVFWPSGRVSKENQYVAVNDPTNGPEHWIYRTMHTV